MALSAKRVPYSAEFEAVTLRSRKLEMNIPCSIRPPGELDLDRCRLPPEPHHRIYIFAAGLLLFAFGALPSAILFSKIGVLIFMACLILARPLQDIAYFTIQMLVIDTLSAIEKRNEFSYILSQEAGFYVGRFSGCMLFIVLAFEVSDNLALRYTLFIVGALQLISIPVAKGILAGVKKHAPPPTDTRVAEDVLEFR